MSARDEFLIAFEVALAEAATTADVARIEAQLGCPLPSEVKSWYAAANGGKAQASGSELVLLSVAQVLERFGAQRLAESAFGFLPFAENNDSNPLCICCKGPLTGFVVQTPHDDEPRLLYRSADGFFREALALLERDGYFESHELVGDIAGDARSERDEVLARELVRGAAADPGDRTLALFFACDLFPSTHVEEIQALAALGDEYLRERVLRRLGTIDSEAARAAIARDAGAFDAFVERCAEMLRAAGIAVTVDARRSRKRLRLDAGPSWLNMPMLFAMSQQDDFEQVLLGVARR